MDYDQRLNTYPAHGEMANRADYPRLWDWLSAHPDQIVTETLWQTQTSEIGNGNKLEAFYKYHGKFSSGDGTTTFRFPQHDDMGYVGLTIGNDPDRSPNTAGTTQGDMIRNFEIDIPRGDGYTGNSQEAADRVGGGQGTNLQTPIKISYGQTKTVGKNVGLTPFVRI
jgi:hypothetical protein